MDTHDPHAAAAATRGGGLARGALAALLFLLLPLAGCDLNDLLEVNDPEVIQLGELQTATGRDVLFFGAIGEFARAYNGEASGTDAGGAIMAGGLLTDEWAHSGTFSGRTDIDARRPRPRGSFALDQFFTKLQQARASLERAARVVGQVEGDTVPDREALATALGAYTLTFLAENFCSGVPLSQAAIGEQQQQFGRPLSTGELLSRALDRFNGALSLAQQAGITELVRLAQVGKARVLVDLGRYQDEAAVAEQVPTSFVYLVERSTNSSLQYNGVAVLNPIDERWSIANQQGDLLPPFLPELDGAVIDPAGDSNLDDEGLPFLAARDPRVPWVRIPDDNLGFDKTSPQYDLAGYPAFGIVLGRAADIPLATGIEARLIEAEAALNAGNTDLMLQILNNLRETVELSALTGAQDFFGNELPPIPPPAERESLPQNPVELLFYERAFWLFATAHRLPDMRRLVGQYERAKSEVFPTGTYYKGGLYGEDPFLPIPERETNNPEFREAGGECLNQMAWDVAGSA